MTGYHTFKPSITNGVQLVQTPIDVEVKATTEPEHHYPEPLGVCTWDQAPYT